jgi:hypothetical protein
MPENKMTVKNQDFRVSRFCGSKVNGIRVTRFLGFEVPGL